MIETLSENVIMPIAGIILTFIACYELIQLVISHNNLANFETWIFWKWIFQNLCSSDAYYKCDEYHNGGIRCGTACSQESGGITADSTAIDDSTLASMQTTLEAMDIGPLLSIFLQSFVCSF